MSIFSHRFRSFSLKGFTLIELTIVFAIITVISALLLLRQDRFSSTTLLRSLAYSVALTFRQAQVYGTSVRESSAGSGLFGKSYGVYFGSGDATRYYLFADINNDGARAADGSEDLPAYVIRNGFSIKKFCGTIASSGTERCSDSGAPITWLVVYFKRPNPDALFSSSEALESYSSAYVELQGTDGTTRRVTVTNTGQIYVGALGT